MEEGNVDDTDDNFEAKRPLGNFITVMGKPKLKDTILPGKESKMNAMPT